MDPVSPRLYSVSSSPAAHGENEVHITVGRSAFEVDSQKRFGLCSDYLSCMNVDDTLEIYVQRNSSFKLPQGDTDVIMIGPGTGIAPFRSFLYERDHPARRGATGFSSAINISIPIFFTRLSCSLFLKPVCLRV